MDNNAGRPSFTVTFNEAGSSDFSVITSNGVTAVQMLTAAQILMEEAKKAIDLRLFRPVPKELFPVPKELLH